MEKLFEIAGIEIHEAEGGGRDLCVFADGHLSHVHHLTLEQRDALIEALNGGGGTATPSYEEETATLAKKGRKK